jgi:Leucine-rich repeat (LRR) protein
MTPQHQGPPRVETLFSQRSTAMLVVGSLLLLVDRSNASLQLSARQQKRFARARGAGSDSINETQVIPALSYVGEPPSDPNVTYGACEGRCSRHEHCQEGLFCIQRFPDDEVISTCLPPLASDANNRSTTVTNTLRLLNYCAEVPENELVTLTEENTTEVTITTACSGGCQADGDCLGDHLKCSRLFETLIPGCSGFKNPLVNYCYFDNSTTVTISNATNGDGISANSTDSPPVTPGNGPTLQYVGEPPFPFLLQECQGDCDSDWQCDYGLNCFKRWDDKPIPGCEGAGGASDIYSVDYCYIPPPGTLVIVQNVTANSTKAGKCEGDCESDDDCVSGLKCYERQNYEEVPGCVGVGNYSTNYCYDPADEDFNSTGTLAPSKAPVEAPVSKAPTAPVSIPTALPTQKSNIIVPTPSTVTLAPSKAPIDTPVSKAPTAPVSIPTALPTQKSNIIAPTPSTVTLAPSKAPIDTPVSKAPTAPVSIPTALPTQKSNIIVPTPTIPVAIPTNIPSVAPSSQPNKSPSNFPSSSPSTLPSNIPIALSSTVPSSLLSSFSPSEIPSIGADALSSTPSENPTVSLSEKPSGIPTLVFSEEPSENPIFVASLVPSDTPSIGGDNVDRDLPTLLPTRKDGSVVNPSAAPSSATPATSTSPSSVPSLLPSLIPSLVPSSIPSFSGPSAQPSDVPTVTQSIAPSSFPSSNPSEIASSGPSFVPVDFPSSTISTVPSSNPSDDFSTSPSSGPSEIPTVYPSSTPSEAPIGGGLVPDEDCPDFAVLGRARAIYKRLMNVFQYVKNEIVVSNETSTSGGIFAGSYQQAAFDWLVNTDEQVACSNTTKLIQRYALAAFWFASGGEHWSIPKRQPSSSYLSKDVGECQWNGITCDDSDNVIEFHLDESNITGTLPIELASLKFLRELNIDANKLSGPMPSWLGQWKKLEVLDMDHNHLTGPIPSSLYSISALRVLDLDSNALTGTISETGIEKWSDSLYFMQLDFNEFVGTIPSVIGKFSKLQYLSLFGNNFTDSLLSSIENLCEGVVTIYANCNMCQNSTCCTACLDV